MRSKGKKKRPAYRRGERLIIFFRKGTVFLLFVVVIAAAALLAKMTAKRFCVREIAVSGNYHLDRKDIIAVSKIREGDSLLKLDLEDVNERLESSSWIKDVLLRKRFPGTIFIKVKEATPKALLSMSNELYILDSEGEVIEKIKGESTPFLPVIKDISFKNRKDLAEALKLVDVLSEKNVFAGRESIEIGLESYGLSIDADDEFMKIGYGGYAEKFDRWMELEPEIRSRGLQLKYVDLRFKDSVIVKPVRPRAKEKTS